MDSTWQGRGEFHSASVEPEILPPGAPGPNERPESHRPYYRVPPPPPPPRQRGRWAYAPATYILVGINCLVFLAMVFSGLSITGPTPEQLIHWGADYGPYVLALGQWWRLITAMFVHIGIVHIATNMWCLWNLGLLGEPLLGPFGLIATYLLTGFAGDLLSVAVHPGLQPGSQGIVGAGASGAIFGIAGVLILLLKSPLLPLPKLEVSRLRRSVIWFAVFNFVIDGGIWVASTSLHIDNMAHLGGFLSGLALGVFLVPRIGAPRALFLRRRTLATAGMAFLLLLFAFGLRSFWR